MKALPYIGWAAITFAVFGWHALWWGILSPAPLPEKIPSTASSIRYLPIEPDNNDPRLKEILAPLIFSTPSLAGFSQPLLEKGAQSVPPLRVVEDLSVQLARAPRTEQRSHTVKSSGFMNEVEGQLSTFDFALPAKDPFVLSELPSGVKLRWQGALDPEAIRNVGVDPSWAGLTNSGWEATVYVHFDPSGKVTQALIEGDVGEKIREQLLIWSRRLRAARSENPADRRMVITVIAYP